MDAGHFLAVNSKPAIFLLQPGTPTITANCMERCTCERQGQLTCTPFPCAAGETCALNNNKWACVGKEGHCTIAHEHIFTSFDGVSGKLPSEGSFEITALVNVKSTSWFRVVVQVKKCPQCATPSVVSVTVYFHKLIVLVNKDSSVSVRSNCWQMITLMFYSPTLLIVLYLFLSSFFSFYMQNVQDF